MNYRELNKTTPYNYYPTGDSAKFDLPEDKVTKFRRLWRKYHPKKKTKQQDNDITCQEPISVSTPNDDNLIMVGGLVEKVILIDTRIWLVLPIRYGMVHHLYLKVNPLSTFLERIQILFSVQESKGMKMPNHSVTRFVNGMG